MSWNVPPLSERLKPGLSETLPFPRALNTCQSCGASTDLFGEPVALRRWMECDEWDQDQPLVVVLCEECSDRLIEPHPRLYKELQRNEPMPGAMQVCTGCVFESALRCTSPRAKINGGPGVALAFERGPTRAHFSGTRHGRRTGWMQWIYHGPVTACDGREERAS